jgi:NACalpha-BTF3-like transcription factor
MEDVESDDTAKDRSVPGELIRKANTAMDEEDVELVYNRTRFQRDKVRRRYFHYYPGRKIISREEPL